MPRSPLSPAHGIATGLKYGAAIWIGAAVIAYGLWCAFDAGADRYAAMDLDRQETNAGSLFGTANGGQP